MKVLSKEKFSLFSVYFVYFLTYFGIAVIFPIFTPLVLSPKHHFVPHDFDVSLRLLVLAMLIAAFPFAQFFGAPLFGDMADLKGRKRAFHFTLCGEAIGFLLTGIALKIESLSFLLFSRFLTGFFAGNLTICLAAIADRSTDPQKRMQNFGYLAMVGGFSFILAVLVGGEFSDQELNVYFDPAFPFWILTAMTLFALGLISRYYKELKAHGGKQASQAWGFRKKSFYIFKIPSLRFLYSIYFFFMLGWVPTIQFLSAFMFEHYDPSKQTITHTLLGGGIMWSLGNGVLNPLLSKKLSSRIILPFSLIMLFLFIFLSTQFHDRIYVFVLGFQGAALFASITWTNTLALVSLRAKITDQGYILGWNQALGCLAMVIAPFICGFLGNFGTRSIFLFISFAILMAFILTILKRKIIPAQKLNNL